MQNITTTKFGHARELLMHSSRWFISVLSAISLVVGLSVASIAAFLLHLRWDLAILVGMGAIIAAVFEGSWRLSCKEKDALDPEWRTKYAHMAHRGYPHNKATDSTSPSKRGGLSPPAPKLDFSDSAHNHELEDDPRRSVQKSDHGCVIQNARRPPLIDSRGSRPNLDQGISNHPGEPSAEKFLIKKGGGNFDNKTANNHNGSETFRQVGDWWCFWFKPLSEPYEPELITPVTTNENLREL